MMEKVLLFVLLSVLGNGPLFAQMNSLVTSVATENKFEALASVEQDEFVQIHISLSEAVNDSLIIFHGDDRNIFLIANTESGVQKTPLDPNKYTKVVIDDRVFESHVIRVPGVRPSAPRFFEKFYSTDILELFELHSSADGQGYVTYFAKFRDSPFLFRLAAMNGEPSSIIPLISIDFKDPVSPELSSGMIISRKTMIKIGKSIEKSKISSYLSSK